jgi:hypothetical protein
MVDVLLFCMPLLSDFCHQQLLRKMRRKIYWTDGRTDGGTDRRTEVKQYTPLTPYGGKLLLAHQIPTSCLSTLLIFIHIFVYAHFSSHFSQQLLKAQIQKRYPQYGIPIWRLWPNIRFLPSTITEKNATKNILDGRKDGRRFWTRQIPTSCLPT